MKSTRLTKTVERARAFTPGSTSRLVKERCVKSAVAAVRNVQESAPKNRDSVLVENEAPSGPHEISVYEVFSSYTIDISIAKRTFSRKLW